MHEIASEHKKNIIHNFDFMIILQHECAYTREQKRTEMHVKGTIILTMEKNIREFFGNDRWEAFISDMARSEPVFEDRIFFSSRISLDTFLNVQQRALDTFYEGDQRSYQMLGQFGAKKALVDGYFNRVIENTPDRTQLIEKVGPKLWQYYFDFGLVEIDVIEQNIEVIISDIPSSHPFFRHTIIGYLIAAFEIIGVRGVSYSEFPADENTLHYIFTHNGWAA